MGEVVGGGGGSGVCMYGTPCECTHDRCKKRPQEGLLGCILLGLFWLFLFRFRNNRIHGISISKERSIILKTEYSWRR